MMVEEVIKEARPQMVGEYYEPYHIDVMDSVESLAQTFPGVCHWIGRRDRIPIGQTARIAEAIERGVL